LGISAKEQRALPFVEAKLCGEGRGYAPPKKERGEPTQKNKRGKER